LITDMHWAVDGVYIVKGIGSFGGYINPHKHIKDTFTLLLIIFNSVVIFYCIFNPFIHVLINKISDFLNKKGVIQSLAKPHV
jgi:hypothetical protein